MNVSRIIARLGLAAAGLVVVPAAAWAQDATRTDNLGIGYSDAPTPPTNIGQTRGVCQAGLRRIVECQQFLPCRRESRGGLACCARFHVDGRTRFRRQ
jgi:hypothetical protein